MSDELLANNKKKPLKPHLSLQASLIIGGISGAFEAAFNHPLWAWKVRAQNSMPYTFNPWVIYRGVLTNMCSVSTIVAARIAINDQCLKWVYQSENPSLYQSISSGFYAGLGAAPISCTIELGLTQQQKVKSDQKSGTFFSTHLKLVKSHGLARGFTGLPSILSRDAVFCAAFLGVAPHLKTYLQSYSYSTSPTAASIAAGVLVGLPASLIAHPFDTVAAIQHANVSSPQKEQRSAKHIANKIITEQGIKGLYRNSLLPRGLRIASATTIFVEAQEKLSRQFNSPG